MTEVSIFSEQKQASEIRYGLQEEDIPMNDFLGIKPDGVMIIPSGRKSHQDTRLHANTKSDYSISGRIPNQPSAPHTYDQWYIFRINGQEHAVPMDFRIQSSTPNPDVNIAQQVIALFPSPGAVLSQWAQKAYQTCAKQEKRKAMEKWENLQNTLFPSQDNQGKHIKVDIEAKRKWEENNPPPQNLPEQAKLDRNGDWMVTQTGQIIAPEGTLLPPLEEADFKEYDIQNNALKVHQQLVKEKRRQDLINKKIEEITKELQITKEEVREMFSEEDILRYNYKPFQ